MSLRFYEREKEGENSRVSLNSSLSIETLLSAKGRRPEREYQLHASEEYNRRERERDRSAEPESMSAREKRSSLSKPSSIAPFLEVSSMIFSCSPLMTEKRSRRTGSGGGCGQLQSRPLFFADLERKKMKDSHSPRPARSIILLLNSSPIILAPKAESETLSLTRPSSPSGLPRRPEPSPKFSGRYSWKPSLYFGTKRYER